MSWYLIHSKPAQEQRAFDNLQRQGYVCFLPTLPVEKVRRGKKELVQEALFKRYLFIQLDTDLQGMSWAPIRSTLGVSRLVTFGHQPAKVPDGLIEALQVQAHSLQAQPERLYQPGQRVEIVRGPFAGLETVYEMADGDQRAIVLLEIMSKPVRVPVDWTDLRPA